MLSLISSLGFGTFVALFLYDLNIITKANTAIWIGIVSFIIVHIALGIFFRKKIKKITSEIENCIKEGQEKINRKINIFQQKPQGGIRAIQQILEKDQKILINQALELTKKLEPLVSWNFLLKKQINTMRFQFYYQLKDFKKVDALMKNAFFIDHISVCMKMAREYINKNENYHKTFKKKIRKFKKENAVLLYALYSWILVKTNKIKEAIEILAKGKDATNNEILKRNWEYLVNGKIEKFSNAGLGELWYSLYLEEPKIKLTKQRIIRK